MKQLVVVSQAQALPVNPCTKPLDGNGLENIGAGEHLRLSGTLTQAKRFFSEKCRVIGLENLGLITSKLNVVAG
jgi:hypothetical protein